MRLLFLASPTEPDSQRISNNPQHSKKGDASASPLFVAPGFDPFSYGAVEGSAAGVGVAEGSGVTEGSGVGVASGGMRPVAISNSW